ncbi:MAG TPA: cytochrome b, partial [Albitalea sp.]|nr:cytochrome b [Albitalea sp.]
IAPRGTPGRAAVINLHKSTGIVLAVFIAVRLLWRLRHAAPAWPEALPAWQRRAAALGHRTLYACMLLMPLSGYLGSNFSKHGVKFFGLALRPWGPDLPQVYSVFNGMHIATAWVFSALIVGHIVIALKHALVDRETVFSRMWPAPRA